MECTSNTNAWNLNDDATMTDCCMTSEGNAANFVSRSEGSTTVKSVSSSDGKDDRMEVDMDVEEYGGEVSSLSTIAISDEDDGNGDDVIDLAKLCGLLEQSKKAGEKIAGKNVLLFFGNTGAGKVCTINQITVLQLLLLFVLMYLRFRFQSL